jgi:hypothetical protein
MLDFGSLKRKADYIVRQGGADTHALSQVVKELCEQCEELQKKVDQAEERARRNVKSM